MGNPKPEIRKEFRTVGVLPIVSFGFGNASPRYAKLPLAVASEPPGVSSTSAAEYPFRISDFGFLPPILLSNRPLFLPIALP